MKLFQSMLDSLVCCFQVSTEPGNKYNIPLMNALVLYVGTQAIQAIQTKGMSPSASTIAQSSHMDIFQSLSVDLDTEGKTTTTQCLYVDLRYS